MVLETSKQIQLGFSSEHSCPVCCLDGDGLTACCFLAGCTSRGPLGFGDVDACACAFLNLLLASPFSADDEWEELQGAHVP